MYIYIYICRSKTIICQSGQMNITTCCSWDAGDAGFGPTKRKILRSWKGIWSAFKNMVSIPLNGNLCCLKSLLRVRDPLDSPVITVINFDAPFGTISHSWIAGKPPPAIGR